VNKKIAALLLKVQCRFAALGMTRYAWNAMPLFILSKRPKRKPSHLKRRCFVCGDEMLRTIFKIVNLKTTLFIFLQMVK